jgi:hypothetical protein
VVEKLYHSFHVISFCPNIEESILKIISRFAFPNILSNFLNYQITFYLENLGKDSA